MGEHYEPFMQAEGRETTLIECIDCGKRQTHRVCAECFTAGRQTTPTGGDRG